MRTCTECGSAIETGRRFCGECGAEVLGDDPASSAEATIVEPTFGDATRPLPLSVLKGGQPVRQLRDSKRPGLQLVGKNEGALALAAQPETSPAETTGQIARAEVLKLRRDDSVRELEEGLANESGELRRPSSPPVSGIEMRPPVLASEALLEDIEPTEPGERVIQITTGVLGLVGTVLVLVADRTVHSFALAAVLCAVSMLGFAPMRYGARGMAVLFASAVGLVLAARTRLAFGAPADTALLPFTTTLLTGSLMFRGYYRASKLARVLIGFGVGLGGLWFFGSGATAQMMSLSLEWQSWLPAVLRGMFVLLLLMSLLAYMESTTSGGCKVWGAGALSWYLLYGLTEVATRAIPPTRVRAPVIHPLDELLGLRPESATQIEPAHMAAMIALPILSAAAGLATLVTLAALFGRSRTATPEG